ncbi:glycoside hydrolase TIM-barrel-like domain-containing protein, partial [Enterovirga sp.]|uniref:baseplate multidomain protein megatron n=1 Tax=Enterovirga sp. TaxID=2026350 RepID=UPI00260DD21C
MTTLLLQAADTLVGGVANAAASFASRAVSGLISGRGGPEDSLRVSEGPRLKEMAGLTSTEGAPIPRVYGRARVGGQLIWATRFEEVATTTTHVERQAPRSGGKGGGARPATRTTVSTSYSYFANLAIGICEGPIGFVRRVWADGREVDLTTLTLRVHRGDESQHPDALIVAKEGEGAAPAYRGLAYVVFERLPLAPWGNRVPQFSFEVVRPLSGVREIIRSVCLIPGATEFGYDPVPVSRVLGLGASAPENAHQFARNSDVLASLDQLQALCPQLTGVSVVVTWFGDDLRAGHCTVSPRVDLQAKATAGAEWAVAGLGRATAQETSRSGGIAAYGGTPSDDGLVRLILELKARGLAVTLYPFLMMDVPDGNGRPDPRTGAAHQPAYPWRGRITCDPAPGRPGTVDGTAAAAAQIAAFFGAAAPAHFSVAGQTVVYAGPPEWSFRRLALHYGHLAAAAGGVDAFVIGSELVGLTRVRSASGVYPATAELQSLAADLRAVLGPGTKLTYAADWTEYGAHVRDGGDEVRFPLDPLWADPAIDAVGIDWYPPLSDWRDAPAHLDEAEGRGPRDLAYLAGRVAGGEAYSWFYAGDAERDAQIRTPITDGVHGEPWLFRPKDLVGWWSNSHHERVGGVRGGATAW